MIALPRSPFAPPLGDENAESQGPLSHVVLPPTDRSLPSPGGRFSRNTTLMVMHTTSEMRLTLEHLRTGSQIRLICPVTNFLTPTSPSNGPQMPGLAGTTRIQPKYGGTRACRPRPKLHQIHQILAHLPAALQSFPRLDPRRSPPLLPILTSVPDPPLRCRPARPTPPQWRRSPPRPLAT